MLGTELVEFFLLVEFYNSTMPIITTTTTVADAAGGIKTTTTTQSSADSASSAAAAPAAAAAQVEGSTSTSNASDVSAGPIRFVLTPSEACPRWHEGATDVMTVPQIFNACVANNGDKAVSVPSHLRRVLVDATVYTGAVRTL